jgi:GLPGLI family protein
MRISWLLILFFCAKHCVAQQHHHLTIVYDITVNKTKSSSGIEETYNGGTRSVFISGNKARIRLVSLMRIESIFLTYDTSTLHQAAVIKESGAKKYRFNLSADDWKHYNKKYDGVTCSFENDSILIAGFNCKKALISLSSGEEIIAYYTDSLPPANPLIEPAFTCIPGMVLQYEHTSKRGVVSFKASLVSSDMIEKNIFVIPSSGIQIRKYIAEEEEE